MTMPVKTALSNIQHATKTGIKTSEFWTTSGGAGMLVYGAINTTGSTEMVMAAGAVLVLLTYRLCRTWVRVQAIKTGIPEIAINAHRKGRERTAKNL